MTKPGAASVAASALAIGSPAKRLKRARPSVYAARAASFAPVKQLPKFYGRRAVLPAGRKRADQDHSRNVFVEPMNQQEFGAVAERHGWEIVGPPPF